MNDLPPNTEGGSDLDDRYRSESALDDTRPSESVRRAVLDHAAQLAAGKRTEIFNARARRRWRGPALAGTLAAAVIVGLMVAQRFQPPSAPPASASNSAPAASTQIAPPAPAPTVGRDKEVPFANIAPAESTSDRAGRANSANPGDSGESAGSSTADALVSASAQRRAEAPAHAPSSSAAAIPMSTSKAVDPDVELRRAAQSGDVVRLQSALSGNPPINARDTDGRTALMLAVLSGQEQTVDLLLAHGADPNAADARGITPLRAALDGHWPTIAVALQRAGAR